MWHAWGKREIHTECRWKKVNETDYLEQVGVDGGIYQNVS